MNAPAVISDIVILYNVHVLYCCEYTHSAICIKYMKHWLRPLAPPLSCSYWLDGVLPMVLDREVGAQEKCLQLLEELLLANITNINK